MSEEKPANAPGSQVAIEDIPWLLNVMRAFNKGKSPHQIRTQGIELPDATVAQLINKGLVDNLGMVPLLLADARPGHFFLTEKGQRWLRTYGRWERWKYEFSQWQLLSGILIGLVVSWISSYTNPLLSSLLGSAIDILCSLFAALYLAGVLLGIL